MSSVSSLFIKKGGYFIYNRHGDVITLFFIYTMVRRLEFYGYDDTAFMSAVRKCCPGCHFNIKIDDDGYIHFVNGDELSVKLDIVYDRETGSLCLYDILEGEIVASGQPVAEIFEEMTSGQTFITDAVASESGITFYTSDVMGESGQTIELPLPTLNIIEGSGIAVSATTAGTMISLDVEVIETMSGVSGIIETVEELVETSEAHTEAIETLSADTETISGNVDNLVESAETLTQEVTDLQAADVALSGAIDDVKTAHTADITTLNLKIDAEEAERKNKDDALSGAIDTEKQEREASDDALSGAVDTEKQEREDADEALSDTIDVLSAYTINDLEPRVATNEGNISGLSAAVQTFQTGLEQEFDDRVSGDTELDGKILENYNWTVDTLSGVVKTFIDNEYESMMSAITSLSNAVTELQNVLSTMSSSTASYDSFSHPYSQTDVAGKLAVIFERLGIEP